MDDDEPNPAELRPGEVLAVFAKLGVSSFGGPIAHIGYFRAEIVERRRWVTDKDFADLVALCQVLPGPTSSQLGFALGLSRGGVLGALAAFAAFTLPSAVLMVALALGASVLDGPVAAAVLEGLKIVAVAIVAQAVLGMAKSLVTDAARGVIAATACALALLLVGIGGQLGAIAVGVVGGILFSRRDDGPLGGQLSFRVSRSAGVVALSLFALVLFGLPLIAITTTWSWVDVFEAFSRSGALVFGGGHVVLPLLQSAVVEPGWVSQDDFLAGYAAAQAMPGPLFTFAGYLGAILEPGPHGLGGAVLALVAIFLPGFLLLIGVLPFWNALRVRPTIRAALRGVNAAVVGILAAALYTPVFTSAITGPLPLALVLLCFALLVVAKLPPWLVVIIGGVGGLAIAAVQGFA